MKNPINYRSILATMAVTVGMVASARADQTAVTFNDSSITVGVTGPGVYGWQFFTYSDIQVSSLGLYDYFKGDGFVAQHPMGIWDLSNPSQPLVSAVIPAGKTAPLVQDFRYVNVSPVTLPAGHDYVIGALYMNEDFQVGSQNAPVWLLTMGPGLQFGGYRYGGYNSTVLTFPESYVPGLQESFGPNFTYSIVVPEPSIWSLCLLGAVGASLKRPFRSAK